MTQASLRQRLREATRATHERLHRHPALSAAATGTIRIEDYRALLARLYGFHSAFEACVGERACALALDADPLRSTLLKSDLEALGATRQFLEALPLCPSLSLIQSDADALGALYVVEGSALGGAQIARALAPVLEPLGGAGRRFFSNDGAPRKDWAKLIVRIETLRGEAEAERAAINAAVQTFRAFEAWMRR